MSIAEKITQIAENEQKVYEAGKKAEYDRFWDAYQINGTRTTYSYVFSGFGWVDEVYNPKYNFDNVKSVNNMFFYSQITDTKKPIDITKISGGNTSAMFQGASSLITIQPLTVDENTKFIKMFDNCTALVNLTIGGTIAQNGFNVQWSTKLNKASIVSIINALSRTTSGLAITLSKTAVNNAFGINVDDTTTYPDGSEYYNLRHSKNNWTINYL